MANDQSNQSGSGNQDRMQELAEKHGGKLHPGMTSPDSTQAPLKAATGEPDEEAMGNAGPPRTGGQSSGQSSGGSGMGG